MRLTVEDVQRRVSELNGRAYSNREFVFDLLAAYGRAKSNITRLRSLGPTSLNVADDVTTEVAQKNVVYFKECSPSSEGELLAVIEDLSKSPTAIRYNTRFVILTDYDQLLAKDIKTGENLIINIRDIGDYFTFFLPWAGMEKAQYTSEAHADIKAAERMAKLFDELLRLNPEALQNQSARHSLNVFFARLLFCFFAEDTGIFPEGLFTRSIASYTQGDGSDMQQFLADVFVALDTNDPRQKPTHLRDFPYVNGRLFTIRNDQMMPVFDKKARDHLLQSGKLQWGEINPDIFGSMFQAVVTPGQRSNLGQHYTSVPNILKTIEPLFLDNLRDELDRAYDSGPKLKALLKRISNIKIFDPAAGSGNFLVIAYKELRKLENAILERLDELDPQPSMMFNESRIDIRNFYGIEIDDFAAEVAILSLWLAKHQMNQEYFQKFHVKLALIPLKEAGNIFQGNATRMDWNSVCPTEGSGETYLISNPPYRGAKRQSAEQKKDFEYVFGERPFNKNLDYISLWFIKGAEYIQGAEAQLAFITTNSIAQGEHVGLLFPQLFELGVEIGYAYTSFKWGNNARHNAGVTVAVVNLRNVSGRPKYLFTDGIRMKATNINGYLANGPNIFIRRRKRPLSNQLPSMVFGSMPRDGGHLILTPRDRREMTSMDPWSEQFIKRYMGSTELINGNERYCLWISDDLAEIAMQIPGINDRLERVSSERNMSDAESTKKYATKPYRFVQISYRPTESIIVPSVSSERRQYVPIGYLGPDTVISNLAFGIYDAEPWVFAILTSRMHMVWMRAVAGALESRIRYSNTLVYNNFPLPSLSAGVRVQLTEKSMRVLDVREYHSEMTLAELYAPDSMPQNLQDAHAELDHLVDNIYRAKGFDTDDERLSFLFKMYTDMSQKEGQK